MKNSMRTQWAHFLYSKSEHPNCSTVCGHKLHLKRGSPNIYMNDCSNVHSHSIVAGGLLLMS
jgi:hypothetical protein